jgi:tRNA threonylcarbamoyladenosine biosynthesis protein TsaE
MNRGLTVSSPEAMMEIGSEFAAQAKPGDVFALVGNLGSGKTHWTKGFLKQLQPGTAVTSPTFSIVNSYTNGASPVHHFDFYRLKSANELIDLGWDEYLDDHSILICEWADMFPELFPEHTQWLEFKHTADDSREIRISNQKSK